MILKSEFKGCRKSWTKIIPVAEGAQILFYEKNNGYIELYNKEMQLLRKVDKCRTSWDKIIPVWDSDILFYEKTTGHFEFYNAKMDLISEKEGWRKSWETITPVGNSRLLFYDRSCGLIEIYAKNMKQLCSIENCRKSWTKIVAFGESKILFYEQKSGLIEIYNSDMKLLSSIEGCRTSWTKIVPVGTSMIMFYDSTKREAEFYDQKMTLLATKSGWRDTWAEIIPLGKKSLMFYDNVHGDIEFYFVENICSEKTLNLGRYKIYELLGEGYFAKTFKAYDQVFNREVAVKIFNPVRNPNWNLVKQEVEPLLRLDHPNIIKLYDANKVDNSFYIALEYANGSSLGNIMENKLNHMTHEKRLDLVKSYMLQILSGIEECHNRNIVHSDLHLGNILLNNNTIKIADFGVAKITHHFVQGNVQGHPLYLAPEQYNSKITSKASDIWGLGVLLYVMVYKQFPFRSDKEIISSNFSPSYDNKSQLSCFNNIIKKALQRDPSLRFKSAREFSMELEKVK